MAQDKLPALQFYTGDWRKDPAVQSLDHAHKGVWIDLLCIMNESPERGRLVFETGAPMDDAAIARNLGIPEAEWKQTRSKLLDYGVASEDSSGVLYNRRMVRDEDLRQKRAEAGRKGGSASKSRSKPASKSEAKRGSSSSSSSSEEENTVVPFASLTTQPAQGAASDTPNGTTEAITEPPKTETVHQQFMPLLRELGYNADATDGSILKVLGKRQTRGDIEAAIRGLALLRDGGLLEEGMGIRKGDKLNLRMLYSAEGKKLGPRDPWWVSIEQYQKHLVSANGPRKRPGMSTVSSILGGET